MWQGLPGGKKRHLSCNEKMPVFTISGFGCNFEHTQFSIPPFTGKEQTCANFIPFCANYVPASFSGMNFSKISMLSLEVYPHKIELKASIASFRLR